MRSTLSLPRSLPRVAIYAAALPVSVISVFPFFYSVATSLKTGTALFDASFLTAQPTLDNYVSLFTVAE